MQLSLKINKLTFPISLSPLLFILIFPTLIVYNLLVSNNLIPAFMGGYFGEVVALTALCFIPFFLSTVNESLKTSFKFSFFGITAFILATLITITSYFSSVSLNAINQSLVLLLMWFALYSLGFYFNQDKHKKLSKFMFFFCLVFSAYLIYQYFFTGNLGFLQNQDTVDETKLSGYQAIARNFLIIALFAYSFIKNKFAQIVLLVLCTFAIFSIGARSEMVAFVLSIITLNLLLAFKNKINIIVSVVILLMFMFGAIFLSENFSDSRQLQIFDFQHSSSWSVRQSFEENAIKTISNNWFWGEFGSHVKGDAVGYYSHNALSAYVNYGLIFFSIYIILNFLFLAISSFKLLKSTNSQVLSFTFLLCFVSFLLVVTTKPVFWPVPYFAWGLVIGALRFEKFGSLGVHEPKNHNPT